MRLVMAFLCVCACGGNDAAPIDGPAGDDDATTDTDAPMPSGPVTVRVLDDGVAIPDVAVVLHANDGTALAELSTDGNGEVSIDDPPSGAMVTVLRESTQGARFQLSTVVGIEPGDSILIGTPGAPNEPTTQVRVTFPGAFPNADSYIGDLGCSGLSGVVNPGSIVTRDVGVSCLGDDDDFDVLAFAREGTTLRAFAAVHDVPQAASGPTDLVVSDWQPAETRTFGFVNLPNDVTQTDIDVRFAMDEIGQQPAQPASGAAVIVPPSSLVEGWYVRSIIRTVSGAETRMWSRRQVLPASTPDPVELDFTTYGPQFDSMDLDTTTPSRPTTSWTTSAPIASLDAIAVQLVWTDPQIHSWTLIVPANATTVTAPALPTSAAAFLPTASVDYLRAITFAFSFAGNGGYAGFRNDQPFELGNLMLRAVRQEAQMLFYQRTSP